MKILKNKHLNIAGIVLILSLSGCFKVSYTFSGAQIPPDAETFSVSYFENKTALAPPSLSNQITEALKDKLLNSTRLNLTERNGDLMYEGEITSYSIEPVSIQSNDKAAATRITLRVKVTFVNMKAHQWDYSTTFSHYIDISSTQNEPNQEEMENLLEKIIDNIFNKSVANW